MAGSSLFLLLDDITTLLDDIASMSKIAGKKTAAVLGDDLAVNAQQLTGISPKREIPVVWAVAKGSFLNKLILVPSALLISAIIPSLIIPLLIFGALYLCFEGFESVWHFLHKKKSTQNPSEENTPATPQVLSLDKLEKVKIKGAIRTDFILSAEIIVITLGVVSAQTFVTQVGVLATVAILITIGVYGLVMAIVKLDDFGLYLTHRESSSANKLGKGLLAFAPWLMKGLSIFGTFAMFLVGGGIITHDIAFFHHISQELSNISSHSFVSTFSALLFDMLIGLIFGALVLLVATLYKKCKVSLSTQ